MMVLGLAKTNVCNLLRFVNWGWLYDRMGFFHSRWFRCLPISMSAIHCGSLIWGWWYDRMGVFFSYTMGVVTTHTCSTQFGSGRVCSSAAHHRDACTIVWAFIHDGLGHPNTDACGTQFGSGRICSSAVHPWGWLYDRREGHTYTMDMVATNACSAQFSSGSGTVSWMK
jgi:hypothetical protein